MTKRPHMPLKVKLDACLIQLGLDPKNVEWHHEPPLSVRVEWACDGGRWGWTPDANDPRHIIPMSKEDHAARTPKDIKTAAKTKRQGKRERLHKDKVASKLTGDDVVEKKKRRIASRPFQKRSHHD